MDARLAPNWCGRDGLKARLEALGIPEDCCDAALPDYRGNKTPLVVAVCCGAVSTASALLAAGAGIEGAYRQLVQLAGRQTEQLGPQAAAAAVPALVQQCAAALFAAPLPNGPALEEAFTAAAELAFPHGAPEARRPDCPWLLEQLLQLHRTSSVDAAHDSVLAACKALVSRPKFATVDHSALSSAIAAWISLPAAGSFGHEALTHIFTQVCENSLTALLPVLLALPRMREALQAEAKQPVALGGPEADNAAPLVYGAASVGCIEVLDTVLAAGGAVTLNSVRWAATRYNATALQLLLRRGRPPVPLDGNAIFPPPALVRNRGFAACPIYAVLDEFARDLDEVRWAVCQGFQPTCFRTNEILSWVLACAVRQQFCGQPCVHAHPVHPVPCRSGTMTSLAGTMRRI